MAENYNPKEFAIERVIMANAAYDVLGENIIPDWQYVDASKKLEKEESSSCLEIGKLLGKKAEKKFSGFHKLPHDAYDRREDMKKDFATFMDDQINQARIYGSIPENLAMDIVSSSLPENLDAYWLSGSDLEFSWLAKKLIVSKKMPSMADRFTNDNDVISVGLYFHMIDYALYDFDVKVETLANMQIARDIRGKFDASAMTVDYIIEWMDHNF